MSRGQSCMLALILSGISEEREKGAITEFMIESSRVSRVANVCLSLDANATYCCLLLLFYVIVIAAEHSSTHRYCY